MNGNNEGVQAIVKDSSGSHVVVSFSSSAPNLAVKGPPGSGITTLMENLVTSLSTEKEVKFILLDGKDVDFRTPEFVSKLKGKEFFVNDLVIPSVMIGNLMERLIQELHRRIALFSAYRAFNYESFVSSGNKDGENHLPRIFVVIQGIDREQHENLVRGGLHAYYRLCRVSGMHLILSHKDWAKKDLEGFQTIIEVESQNYSLSAVAR